MDTSNSIAAQTAFRSGVDLLKAEKYSAAKDAFDMALKLELRYADPLMYRAVLKIHHLDDIEGGIEDCNTALALKPGHPMALGNRAIARLKLKQYDRAVPDFHAALQVNPLDASLHRMKAYCHYELEQYEDAIKHYSMCLRVWHSEALSHDMRGVCYYCRHEFDKALADFNEALALQADNPGTLTNRGLLYATIGEYEQALADHNAALHLREAPAYFSNRGTTYLALSKPDEAQQDCDRALALDAAFGDAYGLRGLLHFAAGRYKEALNDFKLMETYNGKGDSRSLMAQGVTVYVLGYEDQARDIWRYLLAKYPDLHSADWLRAEFRLSGPLLETALKIQSEIG